MARAVLAGAAAHNAGEYGIARAIWSGDETCSPEDDPLRTALAAFATAVVAGRRGEWADAVDAAARADETLAGIDDARGVDLAPVERWLSRLRADPETAERSPPPTVAVDGERPTPGELPLSAAAVVAGAVASTREDDPSIVDDAVRFAREDERPETTRYATFVRDYAAADAGTRPVVFERLSALVERERRKEEDVSGLFE